MKKTLWEERGYERDMVKSHPVRQVRDFYEVIAETRKLVDRHLAESAYYSNHWRMELQYVAASIGPTEDMKILDIGCGPAHILSELDLLPNSEYVGLDLARNALPGVRDLPQAGFLVGNAEALPFASHTFDTVFASHVVEHLHNPDAFTSECFRVLKPKGKFIVATPVKSSLFKKPMLMKFASLIGATISFCLSIPKPRTFMTGILDLASSRTPFEETTKAFSQEEHVHEFELEELKEALESKGFRVMQVRLSGLHVFFYSLTLNNLFGSMWYRITSSIEKWQSENLRRFALDMTITAQKHRPS